MRRVIFHIDVNSAFLSWIAIKILAEGGSDIRLVPAVVSGDPSDRRSIVTAASIPAKKLGIKTAMPVSMALRLCPDLVIVRGDWTWYKRCSGAFMDICRSYSPVLQKFSIDECFIDMTFRVYRKDPAEVACRLKDEVREKLGFTVNVGVGSNKLLAKMASDFEKPDKVHTLWAEEVPEKMWPLPVGDLLWVEKRTREKLTGHGIRTIGDLAKVQVKALTTIVGKTFAAQLHEHANGRDDKPVETEVQEAKSISAEHTFARDIVNPSELDREMFNKFADFSVAQKQCQLPQPTDITALVLNEARRLLSEVWDGSAPIRQVGIGVSKFTRETAVQMSLFEDPKIEYYQEWDRKYDSSIVSGHRGSD